MPIRFEAISLGSYAGAVMVQSNDPNLPSYTFSLTGTATGSSDTTAPRLFIGRPLTDETISGAFEARGWALDATLLTTSNFSFEIDGQPATLSGFAYGSNRQGACDANADLNSPNCPDVGWEGTITTNGMTNGAHTLTLRGEDPSGNVRLRTVTFVVENQPSGQPPRAFINRPLNGASLSGIAYVEGWAIDDGQLSFASLGFKVDGLPATVTQLRFGRYRQDRCDVHVDLASPDCPYVGWFGQLNTGSLSNGNHTLQLTVSDSGGSAVATSRTFSVANSLPVGMAPRGWIDLPSPDQVATGTIALRGWAIDGGLLDVSSLRFFLNTWEVFLSVGYGTVRTDICTALPQFGSPNCPFVGWSGSSSTVGADNGWNNLRLQITDIDGNVYTFDRAFFVQN